MTPSPDSVLIAEDSATQALRLQNTLEKHGFTVTSARDGRAALDALAHLRPTLVISDIQMPVMDGYELCRRLKADPALCDIPLILLTSLSAPQDIIRGLECGADNFVVKPYDEAFLLARIRTVLANRGLGPTSDGAPIPIHFAGERYEIAAGRRQILNLLLSTYETALLTNRDLIQAHEDLKAAQAQLIEAEKLQSAGRLAAGVAHEVRNPLAIMEMGLGFLAGQTTSEDGLLVVGEMREAVKRANDVITGLMEMSSPRELGMRAADVHGVIEHALAALDGGWARAGIAIVRDFAAGLPPAQLDEAKIGQALINVFTNALQAMPEGGTLTIRTRVKALGPEEVAFQAGDRSGVRFREGESVIVLEVSDTGEGMAAEQLGKVFEPFFSTKPTGKGMGLGLTVARKLIELHRGTIRLQNRAEGGAIVTVTLKTL